MTPTNAPRALLASACDAALRGHVARITGDRPGDHATPADALRVIGHIVEVAAYVEVDERDGFPGTLGAWDDLADVDDVAALAPWRERLVALLAASEIPTGAAGITIATSATCKTEFIQPRPAYSVGVTLSFPSEMAPYTLTPIATERSHRDAPPFDVDSPPGPRRK